MFQFKHRFIANYVIPTHAVVTSTVVYVDVTLYL